MTATYRDPVENITAEEALQIERYIDGARSRIGSWWNLEERSRVLHKERSDFASETKSGYAYIDVTGWLARGLEVLGNLGEGIDPTFLNKRGQQPRSALEEDVERQIVDMAEEAEAAQDPSYAYTDAQIELTKAWLAQTDYEVFVRVRYFEEHLKDCLVEYSYNYAAGDGPNDLNTVGPEYWEKIVQAWIDDRRADKPDRLLNGRHL